MSTKIALITGANRTDGIGYAAARQLAVQHGFTVILGSRSLSSSLDDAVKQLEADGAKNGVHTLQIDVADDESILKAVKEVETKFGRLDVLVNNAALIVPHARSATEFYTKPPKAYQCTRQDFRDSFEVNIFGVVAAINAFLPLLAKSPEPRIVNVSSASGSFEYEAQQPTGDYMFYGASKSALNLVTLMYSKDLPGLNPAIKINAACPGYVKTSFNSYSGYRTPEEGAGVITWLATLPKDGPSGGFYCDYPPSSKGNGDFAERPW